VAEGTFNLTNAGTAIVNGSVGTAPAPFFVTSGGGPFSLSPGASVSVVVQFAPLQKGKFKGTLPIISDAKQGGHLTVILKGARVGCRAHAHIIPASTHAYSCADSHTKANSNPHASRPPTKGGKQHHV
jgi:hypothetical protein